MKRIVVKIGTAVISDNQTGINHERFFNLVNFIVKLMQIYDVILVSSGSVSLGYSKVKLNKNIHDNKRVLASLGQPMLMQKFSIAFDKYQKNVSQILLNEMDFDSRKRSQSSKNIIDILLQNGILPIINENDSTVQENVLLGDNDRLSAYATHYFDADLLVILSDIKGYYDKDPRIDKKAKIIKIVNHISKKDLEQKTNPNNHFASGGIRTKLIAAKFLLDQGKETFLCSGFNLENVSDYLLKGIHNNGTLFTKNEILNHYNLQR